MKKHLPLILKILVVCIVFTLILVVVLIFVKNQKNGGIINEEKPQVNVIKELSKEELVSNYKSNIISALNNFNGNYKELENSIVSIGGVPSDFQNLHFDLVVALDYLVFKDDKASSKERLQKIYEDNDWLKVPLDKVIQSMN